MNNRRLSPFAILALSAILSNRPEPRRQPEDPQPGFGPEPNIRKPDASLYDLLFGSDDKPGNDIIATAGDHQMLIDHPFEELPNRARKMWAEMLDEINKIDVNEIDTIGFVALLKNNDPPTPCVGCGNVHGRQETRMISGAISSGKSDFIDAVVRVGLETKSPESNDSNAFHEADFLERR